MSVPTENLGGLYDADVHAALNQYTDKGTIYGTLCGSNRSDDVRVVNLDKVTCRACRQKINGGFQED